MRLSRVNHLSYQIKQPVSFASLQIKETKDNKNLGLGISSSVALGLATYFMFRTKPIKKNILIKQKALNSMNDTLSKVQTDIKDLNSKLLFKLANGGVKVQYSTPVANNCNYKRDIFIFDKFGILNKRIISEFDANSKTTTHHTYKGKSSQIIGKPSEIPEEFLVKKVTIGPYDNFSAYMPGGKQRFISVALQGNNEKTYMSFYTSGMKLHQLNIYEEHVLTDNLINHVQYDYAYDKDGKLAGYAKQHIVADGKDCTGNLQIKMQDGKKIKSDFIDDLYKEEPRFNPKNF